MKISDVPDHKTVFQALSEKYLYDQSFRSLNYSRKLVFNHSLDLDLLRQSIAAASKSFGMHPWLTKEGPIERYSGFSLNFNPYQTESLNINASSLGTSHIEPESFFYSSTEKVQKLKNSYFDSYSFNKRTPSANTGYLDEILKTSKRTIIRSRLMSINGEHYDDNLISDFQKALPGDSRFGWHKDEPIYANLRINIPIDSSDAFVFEMQDENPYELKAGKAYSWNTNIPHRVYCNRPTNESRTNLVIGVSPWFDLVGDQWIPNEFCGKKSPQQMLIDGDVFDWLKLSEEN